MVLTRHDCLYYVDQKQGQTHAYNNCRFQHDTMDAAGRIIRTRSQQSENTPEDNMQRRFSKTC